MAQKVAAIIKLQLKGGQATPGQPVGPALGAHGVNIMAFVKEYNARTANTPGEIIPVELTVYQDKSFTFVTKTSPASFLIKKAAGVERGAANPLTDRAGRLTKRQVREIAEKKKADLNAYTIEQAMKMIEGTARSMGIQIVEG
ncbi:MAG: 50S ribosomal protein L11 [Ardenticatenales bacterium]